MELLLLTVFVRLSKGQRGAALRRLFCLCVPFAGVTSSSFWLIKSVFDRPAQNIQHPDE